jgi:uncharacterized protein
VTPRSPTAGRLFVVLALAFLCSARAFAIDAAQLKPQGYVSDFADVLDASDRIQLERYCASVEHATGAQMAIVTISSLDRQPMEDFANKLFRSWGIGKKIKDEGVLLLLAVRDRKSRIEVGYGLEPILPDGFAGSVLREMRPSLRDQSYGQALIAGAAEIGERIARAKGVSLTRSLPRRAPPQGADSGIQIPILLILVALFFLFAGRGRGGGFLTGVLLGNFLGRSRYRQNDGWGGGGFGGYDGGGSGFGGFGGGSSGGGGASSNW